MSREESIARRIILEVTAYHENNKARIPRIINKTMTEANKEYPLALPAGAKKFTIKMRETDTAFIMAFERGAVDGATPKGEYSTVPNGDSFSEVDLQTANDFKIYVACAVAGKTIEVTVWS